MRVLLWVMESQEIPWLPTFPKIIGIPAKTQKWYLW